MAAPIVLSRLLMRGRFPPKIINCSGMKVPLSYKSVVNRPNQNLTMVRSLSDESGSKDVQSKPKSKKLKLTTAKTKLTKQDDGYDSDSSSSDESDSDSSSDDDSDEEIDKDIKASVGNVAKSFKGDKSKMKSELLLKLQEHVKLTKAQKSGALPASSIQNLISELKVKSSRPSQKTLSEKRTYEKPRDGQRRQTKRQQQDKGTVLDNYKLFQSPALGIFSPTKEEGVQSVQNTVFDEFEQITTQQKMTFPPENSFEEMVRWTKEGKLWQFPINNEQGLEEEATVGFHEHVFLDHLLSDFPSRGPVRHFMELVVTGLSKNPHITVAQKHEHIAWYKEYFADKYQLIEELTVQVGEETDTRDKL